MIRFGVSSSAMHMKFVVVVIVAKSCNSGLAASMASAQPREVSSRSSMCASCCCDAMHFYAPNMPSKYREILVSLLSCNF